MDEILYEEARNTVQALIKDKKRKLLQKKLFENIGKPEELWKIIKKLGLLDKKAPTTSIYLNTKKELTFSPWTIANTFKKHFTNLAIDIGKKLPDPTGKFGILSVRQYYKEINFREKKLKFKKVSSASILKILKEFKTNKATGVDNLAARFLNDDSNILCTPKGMICNLSIKLTSFPEKYKVAKIKPFYKKGLKTVSKNFRPISLLPLISKIIERIIHDQTMNFLSANKYILYKYQSGFRKFHSTDTCLSYLHGKITGFDSGLLTGMVLIDLQKAFVNQYDLPQHFNQKNAFSGFY